MNSLLVDLCVMWSYTQPQGEQLFYVAVIYYIQTYFSMPGMLYYANQRPGPNYNFFLMPFDKITPHTVQKLLKVSSFILVSSHKVALGSIRYHVLQCYKTLLGQLPLTQLISFQTKNKQCRRNKTSKTYYNC